MVFIDSSCIVEFLVKQSRWKKVREVLVGNKSEELILSYFSILEVQSALQRLFNAKGISKKTYEDAQLNLVNIRETWNLVPVSNAILDRAFNLQVAHQLKPGDAVQLASALSLNFSSPHNRFFTFDSGLMRAALLERLSSVD